MKNLETILIRLNRGSDWSLIFFNCSREREKMAISLEEKIEEILNELRHNHNEFNKLFNKIDNIIEVKNEDTIKHIKELKTSFINQLNELENKIKHDAKSNLSSWFTIDNNNTTINYSSSS